MKFVKRSIYLLLAIAMVFSFNAAIEYETLAVEKMNDELLELMSWVSDTTPFSVMIELKDKVPQDKLKKALDEVYKEYDMDAFYASEKNYIGNDKAYEEDYPELLAHYDAYAAARLDTLASFYYPHNYAFLEKYDLKVEKEEYVGSGVPYIHNVVVNKEIVNKMLYDSDVVKVAFYSAEGAKDAGYTGVGDTENDAVQYIRGDINNLGVMGIGIKVGLIESGTPNGVDITQHPHATNLERINTLNGENPTPHSNETSRIIRLLSPYCNIYTYHLHKNGTTDLTSAMVNEAFQKLSNEGVHVINMSFAHQQTSSQDDDVVECIDRMIQQYNIPFVIAVGNAFGNNSSNSNLINYNISKYAAGYNSIVVGGMSAPGTMNAFRSMSLTPEEVVGGNWNQPGNMELYLYSCWREVSSSTPNKPDLVAPAGLFSINGSNELKHGTSNAAPFVTSTIAWMLARNVYMQGKTEQIKAAVIGSAYTRENIIKKSSIHDLPSNQTISWSGNIQLNQNATEDYRGAGVLNAAYCHNIAYTGQKTEFTFTAQGQTKTYIVSVPNGGQPFRVGISWEASVLNSTLQKNVYSLQITKPGSGEIIYSETTTNTLYRALTVPTDYIQRHGGGTYAIIITCTQYNEANDVVGMTWNTINPLGYAPSNAQ